MKNIIYGLRDPRNDVYQYIGKSTVGNRRPLQHLTNSHSPLVNEWVKNLSENWLYPSIDIIEEVENIDDLPEREKHWINHYLYINPELLNKQLIESPIVNVRTTEDEEEFDFLNRICYKIPDILRRERIYRNITQGEMATEMKISRSTISMIENGRNVGFDLIQKYILILKGFDILSKINKQRASGNIRQLNKT